ncbi:MAG: hypothetical protein VYA51_01080 [Planctomycetota bacterium]|nr:hypothetical protein [Planctomycetota bacterium]MEC9046577.1 hypothetical protein [Planctomycetota bacterium]
MHVSTAMWCLGILAAAAACHASARLPGEHAGTHPQSAGTVARQCRELHEAPAHRWKDLLPPVVAAGAKAEATLLELIDSAPSAPGAQASVATLGRIGDARAVALCRRLVSERGALAVEAALALGTLPTGHDDPALAACLADAYTDATLKTAAACSLARHGEREHAPRWIAAIVRAGTPAGRRDEEELGVPKKTRWARERYFIQRLLGALGHTDLLAELDTDAPWPTLERLAPRVGARLRAAPR